MKEFTLNADFGMTASDDGFALYGIHTGDMIMFKAAEDFPTNGSLVAVSIDDGPVRLHLPVQSDYQELTEALKWTEKYLYTAIDDMKNTTHYRQMNFDSRCFFDVYGGDGTHDDLNYKTAAIDILDGNTQTTPKVEARTLSDQEKTIVESLFSDGTPVEDAMTQIMNSPELKTLVSLHPKYKALFN